MSDRVDMAFSLLSVGFFTIFGLSSALVLFAWLFDNLHLTDLPIVMTLSVGGFMCTIFLWVFYFREVKSHE